MTRPPSSLVRHICLTALNATHYAHCNTLQHTATHCDTLRHTATHCDALRRTATHCKAQYTIIAMTMATISIGASHASDCTHSNTQYTLQHSATHCNTLQHTATHCNTLQHTATHCNKLQHAVMHNTLSSYTIIAMTVATIFIGMSHKCD